MLMTCRSRERLEHLRALARDVVGKQAGAGLFWFALERDVDPHQPETFWGPLWQTAKAQCIPPFVGIMVWCGGVTTSTQRIRWRDE